MLKFYREELIFDIDGEKKGQVPVKSHLLNVCPSVVYTLKMLFLSLTVKTFVPGMLRRRQNGLPTNLLAYVIPFFRFCFDFFFPEDRNKYPGRQPA